MFALLMPVDQSGHPETSVAWLPPRFSPGKADDSTRSHSERRMEKALQRRQRQERSRSSAVSSSPSSIPLSRRRRRRPSSKAPSPPRTQKKRGRPAQDPEESDADDEYQARVDSHSGKKRRVEAGDSPCNSDPKISPAQDTAAVCTPETTNASESLATVAHVDLLPENLRQPRPLPLLFDPTPRPLHSSPLEAYVVRMKRFVKVPLHERIVEKIYAMTGYKVPVRQKTRKVTKHKVKSRKATPRPTHVVARLHGPYSKPASRKVAPHSFNEARDKVLQTLRNKYNIPETGPILPPSWLGDDLASVIDDTDMDFSMMSDESDEDAEGEPDPDYAGDDHVDADMEYVDVQLGPQDGPWSSGESVPYVDADDFAITGTYMEDDSSLLMNESDLYPDFDGVIDPALTGEAVDCWDSHVTGARNMDTDLSQDALLTNVPFSHDPAVAEAHLSHDLPVTDANVSLQLVVTDDHLSQDQPSKEEKKTKPHQGVSCLAFNDEGQVYWDPAPERESISVPDIGRTRQAKWGPDWSAVWRAAFVMIEPEVKAKKAAAEKRKADEARAAEIAADEARAAERAAKRAARRAAAAEWAES